MNNFLNNKIDTNFAIIIIIGFLTIVGLTVWLSCLDLDYTFYFPEKFFSPRTNLPTSTGLATTFTLKNIKTFASESDFKEYLKESESSISYYGFFAGAPRYLEEQIAMPAPQAEGFTKGEVSPERISETNVQVPGIDEPDILKTNGKEIYFSPGRIWPIWREIPLEMEIAPPYYQKKETKIIKAFPPTELKNLSQIEESGDLLLLKEKNILVIFSGQKIFGYDIAKPQEPKKKWELELGKKNTIVSSRLYKDKIYLVTKNLIDEVHPCPIKSLFVEGKAIEISCSEIYHPIFPLPIDVTFLAIVLNPDSGQIEKKISFVGSSGQSVLYMSENSLYLTFTYYESIVKFFANFLKEKANDLFPSWLIEKIEKLDSYDISDQAKITELGLILEKYQRSLDDDERLKLENEMENRMADYYKEKMRELEKSGIVKINLEKLEIENVGNVPGYPLNQFALDEYQGNLRIAVTVGERFGWFGFGGNQSSANDIYILDKNLNILGSVKNLGLTERIYSARFIEDKGYLVTFRQTDPFYVLDLSNPQKPELKGELKIPGYSSYLHPITKDKILGIGKEDWQVKISLFDVQNPKDPREAEKYILKESWSDILNTHHAFLLDKKHQIFFLPGSSGGYIFSYKNDKLSMTKAVSGISAKRAIYLNDYLYIVGDNKIVVLNELNWEKIKELEIK